MQSQQLKHQLQRQHQRRVFSRCQSIQQDQDEQEDQDARKEEILRLKKLNQLLPFSEQDHKDANFKEKLVAEEDHNQVCQFNFELSLSK